jgi:hypothetical protein
MQKKACLVLCAAFHSSDKVLYVYLCHFRQAASLTQAASALTVTVTEMPPARASVDSGCRA